MGEGALEIRMRDFSVDEYHRMADVGIIAPGERVELIDGRLVEMAPIGVRHWDRHERIVRYLIEQLGDRARIVGQGSFPLGFHSEPQPDIAVLAPLPYASMGRAPSPQEIYAFVELAESSVRTDLGPKLRLYARHGIPDYLVVDLGADVLIHHYDPGELGYRSVDRLGRDGEFTFSALHDIALAACGFLAASD
jgi:Uma2 family endonuclease